MDVQEYQRLIEADPRLKPQLEKFYPDALHQIDEVKEPAPRYGKFVRRAELTHMPRLFVTDNMALIGSELESGFHPFSGALFMKRTSYENFCKRRRDATYSAAHELGHAAQEEQSYEPEEPKLTRRKFCGLVAASTVAGLGGWLGTRAALPSKETDDALRYYAKKSTAVIAGTGISMAYACLFMREFHRRSSDKMEWDREIDADHRATVNMSPEEMVLNWGRSIEKLAKKDNLKLLRSYFNRELSDYEEEHNITLSHRQRSVAWAVAVCDAYANRKHVKHRMGYPYSAERGTVMAPRTDTGGFRLYEKDFPSPGEGRG